MLLQNIRKDVRKILVEHVDPGHVYRDRNGILKPILPVPNLPGRLFPDIGVELLNQTVFFKQRDKNAGTDHAAVRVNPTHQRFRPGQNRRIGTNIKLRLVVDLELMLLDGSGEILYQLLGKDVLFMKLAVIQADGSGEIPANRVGRHFGAVKTALDVDALVDVGIDADAEPHTICRRAVFLKKTGGNLIQNGLIVLPMRAVEHESISFPATGDASGVMGQVKDLLTDLPQNLVPVSFAEALVDHMEVVDIQNQRVHRDVFVAEVELLGVIVEKLPVIQNCELIALRRLDGAAVLLELDDAADAGQNHIGLIGLRDKINGAQLEALYFRGLIRGFDDDGNVPDGVVGHHRFQNVEPGHHRHHQIQQHQRERVAVRVHELQRFAAVGCVKDFVFILQICAKHHGVDLLVVDDQNLTLISRKSPRLCSWHMKTPPRFRML